MFKFIIAFLVYFVIIHYGLKSENRDVAAWREGRYFVAVLWFIWDMLKVMIFSFIAPLVLIFLLFKD